MCLNRPPLLAGEVAATQSWPEGGVSPIDLRASFKERSSKLTSPVNGGRRFAPDLRGKPYEHDELPISVIRPQ